MHPCLVYITAPNALDAKKIGKILVEERLAACVNIIPGVTSLYWWDGKINEDQEVILIAKTQNPLVERLTTRVKEIHTYDCPCVVSLSITGGNQAFLDWVEKEAPC